jgi:hypothetical protein
VIVLLEWIERHMVFTAFVFVVACGTLVGVAEAIGRGLRGRKDG